MHGTYFASRLTRCLAQVATPAVILVIGWLLFCVYAYPGYMSTDSVDQLQQARGDALHDWYPPMMAYLWRITDHVIAGPFPMLVIQSTAFLLGAHGILRRFIAPRAAAIAACAILLFPSVLAPMAVIWKDSLMAGFLLAGTACLLASERRWRIVGLGLLVLGSAQRYNAPAATLPLVVGLFTWRAVAGWRRYAIAAAAWLAVTALAFGANRALIERKTYAWHNSVALIDLVGTVRHAPPLSDAAVRELLIGVPGIPAADIQRRMRRAYSPSAWWWLVHGDGRVLDPPETAAARDAVAHAWWAAVRTYPFGYLKHRWMVWKDTLGVPARAPVAAVWDGFTENEWQATAIGQVSTHAPAQRAWLAALKALEATPIYRAWMYLLLACALLPLCRHQPVAFTVLASGIVNELSLGIAAPSSDYRYSHWMVACTILGAVLVFAARWRAGRDAASSAAC